MSRSSKYDRQGNSGREKSERKSHRKNHRSSGKFSKMFKELMKSLLVFLVYFTRSIVDKIVDTILELYLGEKKVCPDLRKDFFVTKSAVEIAELIRNKDITSYEVVNAYINRIIEINPVLNAVMDGPFMDALDEAKRIDDLILTGEITSHDFKEKPFLGVPFTTKDSTAVAGKLHTLGVVARQRKRANEDAECVRLLKQAGAIIIATTSIPEVNRWQETRNNIIGQTCNPYDTRRTTGGSSGGEAALVSSAGSCFGLGTDIGGSVRMPSFYCGLFGHKPSTHLVNTRGCTFRLGTEKQTMVVVGPITRYASDLRPILEVLVGPKQVQSLRLRDKIDLKKLRYFYSLDNGDLKCSKICSDLKNSMNRVVKHFYETTGREVEFVEFEGAKYASKLWRYWMTQEPGSFPSLLGDSKQLNPLIEISKKFLGQSNLTLAAVYSLIDSILPAEKADEMKRITKELDNQISELLGDDGVLFYPSTSHVAPFHYAAFVQIYNFHYWSLFNSLHLPATQVPIGLNENGLPLGIQVVANKNQDRLCLAIAEELDRQLGGWVPPFKIAEGSK